MYWWMILLPWATPIQSSVLLTLQRVGPRQVSSFSELLALRVGFAAAQATQNPICFSLIPELFPAERTTAMAAYNSAIYMAGCAVVPH